MRIDDLLQFMVHQGASDLHIRPARPPLLRLKGKLVPLKADPLPPEAVRALLVSMLDDRQKALLDSELFVDFAYSVTGVSRFRATVYHQRGSLSAVFRRVPFKFPTLDEWELPEILKEFTKLPQGLVLVTGPTGAGKSSTLAALVREIVETRPVHVVSIEDPIEFLISESLGSVSQREIGTDTRSFSEALRNLLRQDPDVMMVGEMRDVETMGTVLNAAETGHLVLSTLHTNSAAQTIDRLVSAFPEQQHRQIRQQLSQVLEAVICLKLLELSDGSGLIAAVEIMRSTPRVRKLILDGNLPDLHEEIERSVAYDRMQSLNQSLAALIIHGAITRERALANSPNPAELDLLLRKMLYAYSGGADTMEEEMVVSRADFSNIVRLQEIQKAYEELQERYQRDINDRDSLITRLEEEVAGRDNTGSNTESLVRSLTQEKEKLNKQLAFQRQEYEAKIEKLQHRIKDLSGTSEASRPGIFRK